MSDNTQNTPISKGIVILMTGYLLVFSLFIIYGIVTFWPSPESLDGNITTVASVTFLTMTIKTPDELALIFVIALSGALGSMIHVLNSFIHYVGAKKLTRSWIPYYIMKPYLGSCLGLIFYFVIRGGFFSASAGIQDTSPFTFIGIACLVGMFSEEAILKLKEIAKSVLKETESGADPLNNNN